MAYSDYKDPEARREYLRRWRTDNREQFLEAQRQWRLAHPEKVKAHNDTWWRENRDRKDEYNKRWRSANPEKLREMGRRDRTAHPERVRKNQRDWEQANPERAKARIKKWEKANPDKILAKWRRHRAKRLAAPGDFSADDWATLMARSPHCHWCGKSFTKKKLPDGGLGPPTHDHVIPLSEGGANSLENSVCAHLQCNIRKGAGRFNPITGQGILL